MKEGSDRVYLAKSSGKIRHDILSISEIFFLNKKNKHTFKSQAQSTFLCRYLGLLIKRLILCCAGVRLAFLPKVLRLALSSGAGTGREGGRGGVSGVQTAASQPQICIYYDPIPDIKTFSEPLPSPLKCLPSPSRTAFLDKLRIAEPRVGWPS